MSEKIKQGLYINNSVELRENAESFAVAVGQRTIEDYINPERIPQNSQEFLSEYIALSSEIKSFAPNQESEHAFYDQMIVSAYESTMRTLQFIFPEREDWKNEVAETTSLLRSPDKLIESLTGGEELNSRQLYNFHRELLKATDKARYAEFKRQADVTEEFEIVKNIFYQEVGKGGESQKTPVYTIHERATGKAIKTELFMPELPSEHHYRLRHDEQAHLIPGFIEEITNPETSDVTLSIYNVGWTKFLHNIKSDTSAWDKIVWRAFQNNRILDPKKAYDIFRMKQVMLDTDNSWDEPVSNGRRIFMDEVLAYFQKPKVKEKFGEVSIVPDDEPNYGNTAIFQRDKILFLDKQVGIDKKGNPQYAYIEVIHQGYTTYMNDTRSAEEGNNVVSSHIIYEADRVYYGALLDYPEHVFGVNVKNQYDKRKKVIVKALVEYYGTAPGIEVMANTQSLEMPSIEQTTPDKMPSNVFYFPSPEDNYMIAQTYDAEGFKLNSEDLPKPLSTKVYPLDSARLDLYTQIEEMARRMEEVERGEVVFSNKPQM